MPVHLEIGEDYYQANNIQERGDQQTVNACLEEKEEYYVLS